MSAKISHLQLHSYNSYEPFRQNKGMKCLSKVLERSIDSTSLWNSTVTMNSILPKKKKKKDSLDDSVRESTVTPQSCLGVQLGLDLDHFSTNQITQ